MKIIDVRAISVAVPFAVFGKFQAMTMWYGTRGATNHTIIFIDTDEGITGLGETWDRNEFEILNVVKPRLIGVDPLGIQNITTVDQWIDVGDWLRKDSGPTRGTLSGVSASSISAVDCALWDIMGKVCGKPLYQMLGGKLHDKIRCRYWMCNRTPGEMAVEASKAVEKGWKAFKIKIGTDPKKDVECVKSVREAVGDDIELGFDVNGSYNLPTAIRTLKKMQKYDPSHIEEPIPSRNFKAYVTLKRHTEIPIEFHMNQQLRLGELLDLVDMRAIDLFHINPMQNGSLVYCNKLCAIAEAAGIPVTGQSSAAELGVANSQMLHWIASNAAFTRTNDSSTHLLEPPSGDIITKEFRTKNGCLAVPEGPGLGVEIDQKKLMKYNDLWSSRSHKVQPGLPRTETHYW